MAALNTSAKRSLFKKPIWASTSTKAKNGENEDKSIFGQNHLYQDILDAEKKQRERHAAKRQEQAEAEKQKAQERSSKRRRISTEAEDSDEDGGDSDMRSSRSASVNSRQSQQDGAPTKTLEHEEPENTARRQKTRSLSRTASPQLVQTRSQKNQIMTAKDAIILDDDESEGVTVQPVHEDQDMYGPHRKNSPHKQNPDPKSKSTSKPVESESESGEEDEYLRELKAEARRKARQMRMGIGVEKSSTLTPASRPRSINPQSPGSRTGSHSPHKNAAGLFGADSSSMRAATIDQEPAGQTPEVKIWIKTIIPGAKDLIVNRRIDQSLDKVREFWIKRNELPPAIGEKVFFTWNGTRLYNSTTMRGIIERLKKTHPLQDGSDGDPSHGQITIEAMTDEIFEYRQRKKERQLAEADQTKASAITRTNDDDYDNDDNDSRQPIHNHNDDYDDNETLEQRHPHPPPKDGTIIKLRAPGHDEMQLRVRGGTTMSKILNGFCRVKKIDTSTLGGSWLSYDGDRLDDDATVDECGFEHDDTVDVYLR